MEISAYVFFVALLAVSFVIGVYLEKLEKDRVKGK